MLAEEGLIDLVGDAWGADTLGRAQEYLEEEALPYLPIDTRAFALAVEGRLEAGGEVETSYGKAAVEVCGCNATLVLIACRRRFSVFRFCPVRVCLCAWVRAMGEAAAAAAEKAAKVVGQRADCLRR